MGGTVARSLQSFGSMFVLAQSKEREREREEEEEEGQYGLLRK